MKKFLILALSAVLLLGVLASCATGGDTTEAMKEYEREKDYLIDEAGNVFYFAEAEGEAAILTKYLGKATTNDRVTVPEKFGDRTVTIIGDEAFYNLSAVVEVNIPDSVTAIGKHAFSGCIGLTTVNLPSGTVSIGEAAFQGCTNLVTLNDAEHPLSALESIGKNAFRGCEKLAVLNGGALPETLKTIGDASFWGCASLTSVAFPASVEKIGNLAYYNCTGLTSIKMHEGFAAGDLGQFIFTTEEANMLDKIDWTGIDEKSYVYQYMNGLLVETDADSATTDETAGEGETVTPDESEPTVTEPEGTEPEGTEPEGTEPEGTEPEGTEPEETEPKETEPEETEPEETKPLIVKQSFDELRKNGDGAQGVFTPGQSDGWNQIATVDKTVLSLDFWGWVGVTGEIGSFGYQIGDGPIIYDDSFAVEADSNVQNAAIGAGADAASRMLIKIDISKISGENRIKTYYKNAEGRTEILCEFTVIREAPALTAPSEDVQPVYLISGEALLPPTSANGINQSLSVMKDGYVTIVPDPADPHGNDPYYMIPAGFTGARYVSIKYCTTTADKCNTQIYLASTGTGPSNDNSMLQTPIVGDGNWNLVIFDLDQLKEPLNAEYYVSYFRFDALQAGFQTDEDGNYIYIDESVGNIAKLPMPDSADIDVAYIAFFNTIEDAQAYENGNSSTTPDPENKNMTLEKTEFVEGEDIIVTAVGSGEQWVGIYLKNDYPESGQNGGQPSLYWYFVDKDGYTSGEAVNIKTTKLNPDRPEYIDLPAGEYKVILFADGGYTVAEEIQITIKAAAPVVSTNVALNQSIEATSTYSFNGSQDYIPEKLVDGIWEGTNGWIHDTTNHKSTDGNCDFTITITLNQAYTLEKLIVKPMNAWDGAGFPRAYELQISMDGTDNSWTTVASETDKTVAVTDILTYTLDAPTQAKFVRLHVTKTGTAFLEGDGYYAQLGEIEAWGY